MIKLRKLRFRFIVAEEYQPIQSVPKPILTMIWSIIAISLYLQVTNNLTLPPPKADAIDLPSVPGEITLSALTVGDEITFAKATTLWLQAFDNQQGQSLSFNDLDYTQVVNWLRTIIELDPRSQYPMLNAARVYTVVRDKTRLRLMIGFVREQFLLDPASRWEWMAAASTLAKNKVDDLELARDLAHDLRVATEGIEGVPGWARQMEAFLLEDLNEYEASARLMLQLIESGEVTDPQEFNFLYKRLTDTLNRMLEERQIATKDDLERMFAKLDELHAAFLQRADQVEN